MMTILTAAGVAGAGSGAQVVEGLYYRDHRPVAVEIRDGRIVRLIRREAVSAGGGEAVYVAPGLIDNQVNGYAGVSFGFAGGDLTVAGIRRATEALWRQGVTTYLPTLTTNADALLRRNFAVLAAARREPDLGRSLPGFHLEGPYISPEDGYRGAHPRAYVRPPDWEEFLGYWEASEHGILQVSLAPEVAGALDLIRRCRQLGIVVALAHHNGSAAVIRQAVDAGAAIATHLGNGCANLINRHANPLWPQLADERLRASIICDGFHLRPEEVQVFFKVKGPSGIVLTSDVTRFAGMKPGLYTAGDKTVELTPEGMIRYPAQQVLAGAASPITRGVGHIMRFTQCPLREAVDMASRNPARLYGLDDRGVIAPGKRADLIRFTLRDGALHVTETYVAGERVYAE